MAVKRYIFLYSMYFMVVLLNILSCSRVMNIEETGDVQAVSVDPALENSLVGEWLFNGNAVDSSGKGNNGTRWGVSDTNDRFGDDRSAFYFNGIRSYISVPEVRGNGSLHLSNFTIMLWVRTKMTNESTVLIKQKVTNGNYFGIFSGGPPENTIPGGIRVNVRGAESPTESQINPSNIVISDDKWHHIVFVRNYRQYIKLYIDGKLIQQTEDLSEGKVNNGENLFFGTFGYSSYRQIFKGFIDDVRIFRKAISRDQVTNLYHEGGWRLPVKLTFRKFIKIKEQMLRGIALSPDGQKLYTAQDDMIGIYDVSNCSFVGAVERGERCRSVAVSADGRYVYGSFDYGNFISRFDTWNNNERTDIDGFPMPRKLWITPDGSRLIASYDYRVANFYSDFNALALINIRDGVFDLIRTISLTGNAITFSQSGEYAFVCSSNSLVKIATSTFSINNYASFNVIRFAGIVNHLGLLYAVGRDKDSATVNESLLKTGEFGLYKTKIIRPRCIALHPDNRHFFVAGHIVDTGYDSLYACHIPDIAIAGSTNRFERSIIDILFSKDGKTAYLAHASRGFSVVDVDY